MIISNQPILHPKVLEANLLLCMSQGACDRYGLEMKKGGMLLLDDTNVDRAPTPYGVRVPITAITREATGRTISSSITALGVLVGLTGVVSRESLEKAVRMRVPKGTTEMNLKALARGFQAADELKEEE